MFAAVVGSRGVTTDLQKISDSQFAFNIPSQPPFSYISVFLVPGNTIPPDTAAGIYIQIPPSTDFKFLGALANDKQSAIFRINAGASNATGLGGDDVMVDEGAKPTASIGGPNIVLGISAEPLANIEAQLAALKANSSTTPTSGTGSELVKHTPTQQPEIKILAQRIIKNAFNYLSSFATGSTGNETVPLKTFQEWWNKFEKKIEHDPSFLERDDPG